MKLKSYSPFHIVNYGDKVGMTDEYGNMMAYPVWDAIHSESDRHAVIRLGRKFGAIDAQGRVVAAPVWDRLGDCSEGIFIGKMNGGFFLVKADGSAPIPVNWDECRDVYAFFEGTAVFMDDFSCKYGCLDSEARVVIAPLWDSPAQARAAFKRQCGCEE